MRKKKHLLQANEISESTGRNMKTRVISGLVLLVVCLPALFVGSWFFFGIIALFAGISIFEVIRVPRNKKIPKLVYLSLYAIGICYLFWPFIRNLITPVTPGSSTLNAHIIGENWANSNQLLFAIGFTEGLSVSIVILGISFAVLFLTTISAEEFTIKDVFYYFGMSILVTLGFQAFYYIRYLPFSVNLTPSADNSNIILSGANILNSGWYDGGVKEYLCSGLLFLYVVVGTFGTDIGAYFIGVLFGKHKMNPRVSPKKTWEGFFGGIVISILLSISFIFILDACGVPILPGFLDIEHWYWVILISIAMPLIANLGDLAFSAIKRDYDIKDYGRSIPGHGGILDRVDSLLFTSIAVSILLMFIVKGWQIV